MIAKKAVIQAFNQAAAQYDQAAELQKIVATELLTQINTPAAIIIDLGCGTGILTEKLAQKFPHQKIFGIDFANTMLRLAKEKIKKENITWFCADAQQLPFKNNFYACVSSNLMLQWATDYKKFFSESFRILKPQGKLICSTFAPGSLRELKLSWQKIDNKPHIHSFISAPTLIHTLNQLSFRKINIRKKTYIIYYREAMQLMKTLKILGASNLHPKRLCGLTTQHKLNQVINAYEIFRHANQLLPVTYEIFFIEAIK